MDDIKKYCDIDFYSLIGVDYTATQIEIRKAYRKKALECHPDKNPGNPKAAELFHELSKALEILSDTSARLAYDKLLNAKKAAELRTKQLSGKRKKFKIELEEREKLATSYDKFQKTPEEQFRKEFERLQKEGFLILEQEQNILREQLQKEKLQRQNYFDPSKHRIKIKWKSVKNDPGNGGYNEDILKNYLKKYGDIIALVISKKCGSALVEFSTLEAGEMAIAYEKGNLLNPLILEYIEGIPSKSKTNCYNSTNITDSDYESLVLRELRQAEERKRLIEQMMKKDTDS